MSATTRTRPLSCDNFVVLPHLTNDDFLSELRVDVVAVDQEHLRWARSAHVRYGRGSASPATLNFGDCLAYGAARAEGRPLLFKGSDFVHTDVESAL